MKNVFVYYKYKDKIFRFKVSEFEAGVDKYSDISSDSDFVIFKNNVPFNFKNISHYSTEGASMAEECFERHAAKFKHKNIQFVVENKNLSYMRIDITKGFDPLVNLNLRALDAVDFYNIKSLREEDLVEVMWRISPLR